MQKKKERNRSIPNVALDGDLTATPQEKAQAQARMVELGREYETSAALLRARVRTLREALPSLRGEERRRQQARVRLLEQEIREARQTGADAVLFYAARRPFLPHRRRWPTC